MAWAAPCDDVDDWCMLQDVLPGEGGDVIPAWDVGPVAFQDSGGVFVPFALEHGLHTGTFQSEVKAADS